MIGWMNTAENTMSAFSSAKAAGLLEAEDKFHSYQVRVNAGAELPVSAHARTFTQLMQYLH